MQLRGIIKSVCVLTASSGVIGIYLAKSGNETFYKAAVMPSLMCLDAEQAHRIAVKMATLGLSPSYATRQEDKTYLETKLWERSFENPIGLAAGFDKNGECIDGMMKMGFGFVEIGTITPKPQVGNQKPRIFRLKEDEGIINRCGFNNCGLDDVRDRLRNREQNKNKATGVLGISVGKNKTTIDAVSDFVKGVEELGEFADYLVINVSSPNTPGLRRLQGREQLSGLISKVLSARNNLMKPHPPLLVKLAPDLTDEDKDDIAAVVTSKDCRVDGIIVTNTTTSRPPSLCSTNKTETGGLSGKPLTTMATVTIADMYTKTNGSIPIIGIGGIASGSDAYDKIRAGASLVQLYSAMVYKGPPLVKHIKNDLADLLRRDGFRNVSEAVGAYHKKS